MPKIQTLLDNLVVRNERLIRVPLILWFDFAQKQIKQDLTEKYQKSVTSELTDWELIQSQGETIIKPAVLEIMRTSGNAAYQYLAIAGSFDVVNVQAVKAVNKFCSKLVREVTKKTKQGINVFIKWGVKEGKSMQAIARELKPLVGLTGKQTQAIIHYRQLLGIRRPDLSAVQVNREVMKYTNKIHRMRMENIARTETARAQNIGYCQGLEQVGITEAEFSVSPTDVCDDCLALNGQRFPIAEAAGIIPVHPRGRCAMLPVVSDKVVRERLKTPPKKLKKAVTKIEPVDPPDEAIRLKRFSEGNLSLKQALKISQKLRRTYAKQMSTRAFGEMENAILNYDAPRNLAIVNKKIVGAISFYYDALSENIYISHIGTVNAPKGTGAELMRTVVEAAFGGAVGLYLESTAEAKGFYERLGFKRKKTSYDYFIFEADFKRVRQIKEALGSTGRVKEQTGD